VAHAVYLAAIMPASGVPAAACVRMPENAGGLLTTALVADPAAVGALRLDMASPDPAYQHQLREAFYGDLADAAADAAIALLTRTCPRTSPLAPLRSPPTAGAACPAAT
jgi:hypothetical protein